MNHEPPPTSRPPRPSLKPRPSRRPSGDPSGRPSRADLSAADGKLIPDLVRPGLRLLLVGINPGRYSGATGRHFGNPANRLWPALHQSGLTPRRLHPSEGAALLDLGIGITNVVGRTTRAAADLTAAEIHDGVVALRRRVAELRPKAVAVLGKSTYEIGFGVKRVALGPQPEPFEGASLWVLPNPSGANAAYQLPDLVARFTELREWLDQQSI